MILILERIRRGREDCYFVCFVAIQKEVGSSNWCLAEPPSKTIRLSPTRLLPRFHSSTRCFAKKTARSGDLPRPNRSTSAVLDRKRECSAWNRSAEAAKSAVSVWFEAKNFAVGTILSLGGCTHTTWNRVQNATASTHVITTGTSCFEGSWSASLYNLSSSLTIALRSDWLNELSKLSYFEPSAPKPTNKSSGGFSFPNETPRTCITVSICSSVRWSGVPLVSPINATTRSFCAFAAMCTNVDFPQPTSRRRIERLPVGPAIT